MYTLAVTKNVVWLWNRITVDAGRVLKKLRETNFFRDCWLNMNIRYDSRQDSEKKMSVL